VKKLLLVPLACLLVAAPAAAASPTRHASVPVVLDAGRMDAGWRVLAPARIAFRFDLVGLRWHARGPVELALRTRGTSGTWSSWTAVAREDGAGSEPIWARASRAVQVRVRGAGRVRALRVEAIRAETSEAIGTIDEIGAVIGRINEYQSTIASAVEEQAATTEDIARRIEQASGGAAAITEAITGVAASTTATHGVMVQVGEQADELQNRSEELQAAIRGFVY